MAQTKRKRRTKHRGTAAGTVEARGRTGRKPQAKREGSANNRTERMNREPSWRSAFTKAAVMACLLFVITYFGGRAGMVTEISLPRAISLSVIAVVFYTPLAYFTDRAMYNWRQRRSGPGTSRKAK